MQCTHDWASDSCHAVDRGRVVWLLASLAYGVIIGSVSIQFPMGSAVCRSKRSAVHDQRGDRLTNTPCAPLARPDLLNTIWVRRHRHLLHQIRGHLKGHPSQAMVELGPPSSPAILPPSLHGSAYHGRRMDRHIEGICRQEWRI